MASRALFQTFSRARCYNPLTARVSSTRVVSGLTYRSATTAANAQPSAPPEAENTEKVQNGTSSEMTSGFPNQSYTPDDTNKMDWSRSYFGLSSEPFSKEISTILQAPVESADVEITPDGLVYLPEIKYRRILNKAFGPGGWGLAPRSETNVGPKIVSREYALVCLGRLVGISRGEQEYFDPNGIATATEACKSNALMRCCKDLGIASELWDPRFIRQFKEKYCLEVFAEHQGTKRKKKLWRRRDQPKFDYPYKE
ncbi:mitochondrial genome maintenance MGM101 [Pyrrhoderma noxium]|uniref:Mitochondrial genome maintenance protein MGM101 n=1 Tax=Pyrrhoderma noxium TaxID=2282107 RepID=A0A286UNF4_9AGAM|nr:mitochondrial genome maintenance MGM101 [Pyrrhoderma noxium]